MTNINVLYGVEKSIIDDELKKLINEINPNGTIPLISYYDAKENKIEEIIEDALMPSLLSDKKIIIIEDAFFLTAESIKTNFELNVDYLLDYLKHPNELTYLFFKVNAEKLDERKKIVKELKKSSTIFEAKKLSLKDLISSIYKKIIDSGYQTTKDVVSKIIDRGGHSYSTLEKELEKLFIYKLDDKKITLEDVDALVTKKIEENIFDLIDSIINKDYQKIFEIYHELLNQNEEEIKIIILLANQYRLIYQTKILYKKGLSDTFIANVLGVHPYPVKLALNKINLFSEKALLDKLLALANLDEQIKMGLVEKSLALEMFLLE